MLSKDDEVKFGFTENLRTKPKYSEFNLDMNMTVTEGKLPRLNNQ